MSPSKDSESETILSNEIDHPQVDNPLDKDLEKDAEDQITPVISNGPKIEKGPNKKKYFDNIEPNTADTKIISLDKDTVNPTEVLSKCPLCDECFPSSHSFTLHIRQHNINSQSNTCRLCNKTLSSASSLDRHMLVHSGERPFKCKICHMAFTTNGNMHRHMRTHGDANEECPKLKNSVKRKSSFDAVPVPVLKKMKLEEDKQYNEQVICPVCGKAFLCKYGLHSHMETHPNDPIRCLDCGVIWKDYHMYIKHQCLENAANSENENALSTPKTFVGFHDLSFVEFTSEKFSLVAKSLCERETRQPSSAFHRFECDKCNKAFPCSRALNLHKLVHTDKIGTYCPSCKCDFQTPEYLYEHRLKHRSAEHCWPEIQFSRLPESERAESTKDDFLVALGLKTTNFQNATKIDLSSIKEEDFENMSYFIFGKTSEESLALKKKSESDSIKANPCNSDFADIQSIISLTSKTPLMPCIRSSPVTATPASPPQPQIASCSHPESPLLAESAQASPATPQKEENDPTVYKESAIENDKEEKSNESGKSQKMSRNHYKLGERHKTFPCDKCDYSSLDKGTLKRHLRTHNGERPFQCTVCNYAFTTKANCERHIKQCHKKINKEDISSSMRYNPNMVECKDSDGQTAASSHLETVCKYCNFDFKNQRVLRHHLRSLNNSCNRKPYFCNICKLGFSTKNNCIRHIGKQHPHMKDRSNEVVCEKKSVGNADRETTKPSDLSKEEPLNLSLKQSSVPAADVRYVNEQHRYEDIVNAAKGLVSLSEMNPPQMEPLDLTVHALDLSSHKIPTVSYTYNPPITNDSYSFGYGAETQISYVLPERLMENSAQVVKSTYQIYNDSYSTDRPHVCSHCPSRFTLKSNKDRHIKKKHPQFARPTRSRNYIPNVTTNMEKPSTSAVSTETRNALRFVLSNKGLASLASQQDGPTSKEYQSHVFDYSERALKEVKVENCDDKESPPTAVDNVDRETAIDLASISDVIDTANCQEFKVYLDEVRNEDKLDVNKSKKASKSKEKEGKNSTNSNENAKGDQKKRSSYADSPNSIPCPYCKRGFPWKSSLRRHLLTHTGQKPFKCPKCPIHFTTKSNCERHLVRKHSASSDFCSRSVPERPYKCRFCTSSTFSTHGNLRKHQCLKHRHRTYFGKEHMLVLLSLSKFQKENSQKDVTNCAIKKTSHDGESSRLNQSNTRDDNATYCCHLCCKLFRKKNDYFAHIEYHFSCDSADFEQEQQESSASNDNEPLRISCAFCAEIFDSIDRLSDHMISHATNSNGLPSRVTSRSGTDREVPPNAPTTSTLRDRNRSPNSLLYLMQSSSAANSKSSAENVTKAESPQQNEDNSDLIQNLLGIHDSSIIDQMLDSADSAARLLGVKKDC